MWNRIRDVHTDGSTGILLRPIILLLDDRPILHEPDIPPSLFHLLNQAPIRDPVRLCTEFLKRRFSIRGYL